MKLVNEKTLSLIYEITDSIHFVIFECCCFSKLFNYMYAPSLLQAYLLDNKYQAYVIIRRFPCTGNAYFSFIVQLKCVICESYKISF